MITLMALIKGWVDKVQTLACQALSHRQQVGRWLLGKLYLVPLGAVWLLAYDYAHSVYLNRLDLADKSEVMISVAQGDTFTAMVAKLDKQGMLPQEKWVDFSFYTKVYGKLSDSERNIEVGKYIIRPGDTFAGLVQQFVKGDSIYESIRVMEGARARDVLKAMHLNADIRWSKYDASSLPRLLGIAQPSIEGWLLPDTYRFHSGIEGLALLKHIHQAMVDVLMENWEVRAPNLPLKTPYEVLILASIIEKETALIKEKPRVAAVFINRLKKGMRLQADPTVIYGLGDAFKGNLTKTHLKTDNPHNTYTRKGLPLTPVALPSKSSIYAATHPSEESSLYFVSMGNRKHYFSKTYAEHRKAVYRYQIKPSRKKKKAAKAAAAKKKKAAAAAQKKKAAKAATTQKKKVL